VSVVTATDRVKGAIGALAVAATLAGCGGSGTSDAAAIRAVLAASPATYLHYDARDWGRQPYVHVRLVQVDADREIAQLSASGTITQHITLLRSNGVWSIKPTLNDHGAMTGPRAERPATPTELAAISAAEEKMTPGSGGCVTYTARISTFDSRYALVDHIFPRSQQLRPHGRCGMFVGNGEDLYVHARAGWRYVTSASTFPCDAAPPGVMRSFLGGCFLDARG
jgi:hypothetical protein